MIKLIAKKISNKMLRAVYIDPKRLI